LAHRPVIQAAQVTATPELAELAHRATAATLLAMVLLDIIFLEHSMAVVVVAVVVDLHLLPLDL
jgi:hypothetical protein